MHSMQTLTQAKLIELFPEGTPDWAGISIKGVHHTFSTLRARVLQEQAKKSGTQLKREENVKEMHHMLEDKIKNGEVFINQTQPNVHINGCKCYITCGSGGKHRLGIVHAEASFDDMQQLAGVKGTPSTSKKHILFNNLTFEEICNMIKLLCGE